MPSLDEATLRDVQGVGLAGFRKDQQKLLFIHFADAVSGQRLLAHLAAITASALEVRTFNTLYSEIKQRAGREPEDVVEATWIAVLLSSAGYETLGVDLGSELPGGEGTTAFIAGMAARSDRIGDTRSKDAPKQWLPSFREKGTIHALVIIASDDKDDLREASDDVQQQVESSGCDVVHPDDGATLEGDLRGHEHFGFKDGVSQPAVDGYDSPPQDGEPAAVPAGEFILGLQNAGGDAPPYGELWRNGSFAVYRRLTQNVFAFRTATAAGLPVLDPPFSAEKLRAKLIGRWPSGDPLALDPDADTGAVSNSFNYADDPEGLKAPRFAHIRKVNPREEVRPDPADPVARHRMIRRGIPFGSALPQDAQSDDGEQRGLHFLSFVSDLDAQFEFIQRKWASDPNFPNGVVPEAVTDPYHPAPDEPPDGPDPVIGERDPNALVSFHVQGAAPHPFALPDEFVAVTAGEYFFAPSITALTKLGQGATNSSDRA